jgi:hypothetical protein
VEKTPLRKLRIPSPVSDAANQPLFFCRSPGKFPPLGEGQGRNYSSRQKRSEKDGQSRHNIGHEAAEE